MKRAPRLSHETCAKIRDLRRQGFSHEEIARAAGVAPASVGRVLQRDRTMSEGLVKERARQMFGDGLDVETVARRLGVTRATARWYRNACRLPVVDLDHDQRQPVTVTGAAFDTHYASVADFLAARDGVTVPRDLTRRAALAARIAAQPVRRSLSGPEVTIPESGLPPQRMAGRAEVFSGCGSPAAACAGV